MSSPFPRTDCGRRPPRTTIGRMNNEHTDLMLELEEVRFKANELATGGEMGFQVAEAVTILCDIVAKLAARIEAMDGPPAGR